MAERNRLRQAFERVARELRGGRLHRAKTLCEQFVAAVPKYAAALFNLAVVLAKRGDRDAALARFRRAVELDRRVEARLPFEIAAPLHHERARQRFRDHMRARLDHRFVDIDPPPMPPADLISTTSLASELPSLRPMTLTPPVASTSGCVPQAWRSTSKPAAANNWISMENLSP